MLHLLILCCESLVSDQTRYQMPISAIPFENLPCSKVLPVPQIPEERDLEEDVGMEFK